MSLLMILKFLYEDQGDGGQWQTLQKKIIKWCELTTQVLKLKRILNEFDSLIKDIGYTDSRSNVFATRNKFWSWTVKFDVLLGLL